MKRWSTTPVGKSRTSRMKRMALLAVAVITAVVMPIAIVGQTTKAESIAELNAKIDALEAENRQYNAAANKLSEQADTLANKISARQNQLKRIQVKIDLTQTQHDKLKKQIEETKQKIADNKDALGETIADMYVDSDITPLEMLASSKNIGDFVDKQTYQSSINDQLTTTIKEIDELKARLEDQQEEVKLTLLNQKKSRQNLEDARAELQQLLQTTKGKEATYNKMIQQNKAQQDELSQRAAAQMRQTIQSGGANVVSVGGSGGGYPYNCRVTLQMWGGSIVPVSPWTDDGNYGCSQCVSYAAWKLGQVTGRYPSGWGDAYMFANTAKGRSAYSAGFRVTTQPRENSVVYFPPGVNGAGSVGHVGWVPRGGVNGNTVTVQQYNYNFTGDPNGWGKYSVVNFPHIPGMEYIYVAGH